MGIWPLLYEVTRRVIPHLLVASLSDVEEILSPGRTQAVFPQNRHRPSVLVVRSAKALEGLLGVVNFAEFTF
jgi:hypothetical protein